MEEDLSGSDLSLVLAEVRAADSTDRQTDSGLRSADYIAVARGRSLVDTSPTGTAVTAYGTPFWTFLTLLHFHDDAFTTMDSVALKHDDAFYHYGLGLWTRSL